MINETYGRLTVVKESENSTTKHRKWDCICECGNTKSIRQDNLKNGNTRSCGCWHKEQTSQSKRKQNVYRVEGDIAYVEASNTGNVFVIDAKDLPIVIEYCWYEHDKGYLVTKRTRKLVRLHRLLLDAPDSMHVDHKDRDKKNNRRENLRLATPMQNSFNKIETNRNTSGHRGVSFIQSRNRWVARLRNKHLGYFDSFDEAVEARLKSEREAFGEFAPV